MNYGNVIKQISCDVLPNYKPENVSNWTVAANLREAQKDNWRIVVSVDEPSPGYRALTYTFEALNATECVAHVATQKNIAEEQAEQAAAELAAKTAKRAAAKAQLNDDPVLETLVWGVCQCAVKSGLAANATAAKQLLITHFDAIPL